LPATFC